MDIKQQPVSNEQCEFWSKVVEKYDGVVDAQIGPRTRSMVRDRLSKEEGLGELVEYGGGTGFYTPVLATESDRVVATDLSPAMIGLAKKRVTATNVSFQVEDCQNSTLPSGAFDTAFISLVI